MADRSVETIIITRVLPITRDYEDFIELITGSPEGTPEGECHCGDVLLLGFSGYWAYGIKRDPSKGWLVYVPEHEGEPAPPEMVRVAKAKWAKGEYSTLPMGFYAFDREFAKRVLVKGLNRWGDEFIEGTCDYNDYDWAVQTALFGEVVYG